MNENEPRVPAGSPDGGQWTSEGGSPAKIIATGQHAVNQANYQAEVQRLKAAHNPYNRPPKEPAPGTFKAQADAAIARAEKTVQAPTVTLKDAPEYHTPAARLAGMDRIGGSQVSSKIAASRDLGSTAQQLLKTGAAGKTPHPEAILAANKIWDAKKRLGLD